MWGPPVGAVMLTVVISEAIGGDPHNRWEIGTVDVHGGDIEGREDLVRIVRSLGRTVAGEGLETALRDGLPWWNGYVVIDVLKSADRE